MNKKERNSLKDLCKKTNTDNILIKLDLFCKINKYLCDLPHSEILEYGDVFNCIAYYLNTGKKDPTLYLKIDKDFLNCKIFIKCEKTNISFTVYLNEFLKNNNSQNAPYGDPYIGFIEFFENVKEIRNNKIVQLTEINKLLFGMPEYQLDYIDGTFYSIYNENYMTFLLLTNENVIEVSVNNQSLSILNERKIAYNNKFIDSNKSKYNTIQKALENQIHLINKTERLRTAPSKYIIL